MTVDDERTNWKHHEQIERDTIPLTPEGQAAARLVSLVGTHLDRKYVTERLLCDIAAKYVAARDVVRQAFDELDADPKAIGQRDKVLRQQPTATLDQYDHLLELAAEHKQAWSDLCAEAEDLRRRRVAEFDPDAVAEDREDVRAKEQRQDDHAAENAPRGIAS